MLRLDHDTHALCSNHFLDRFCDLAGEPFLHLWTACKHFHCARQFGQSRDPAVRQIPDMRDAFKRQEMMFLHIEWKGMSRRITISS